MSSIRLPVLTITCLLLAACTTGGQIVPIDPRISTAGASKRGDGRTLSIEVVDARASDVIGYRDGSTQGSVMTSAPETLGNIEQTLTRAFSELGFTLVPPGDLADVAMTVRLTELGYTRDTAGVVRNLDTGATIEVSSVMTGKTVTATYRDRQDKDTVLPPSREENAAILNHHLSGALAKLVGDARLTTP